ncbi:hypothetical protein SPRG_05202 [Saprolegnia parasitica CBS 223.65]|uniref:Methyltransferase domain-containing protein n=1 Tax=Saprolegnia parasitica (strain CBS 223.65) TaxID=695850 RepID=A0A067CHL4_SAPPC|nr:hypothetical protein SPRG_05202 [Saprolegnia parasitica CBS 223.65]KDO30013.1 hypothetical protein SPRG_05202 [Saprolegnia parasitica CBS 223.65]|eukprot:XP_012199195.1 hypothetical protein SPRG_05202 [Saprolegnia parasitica CBS 223.65]
MASATTLGALDALAAQFPMQLYPRPAPFTCDSFRAGDLVYVSISSGKAKSGEADSARQGASTGRLFARARVVETAPTAFPGRVKIVYADGSTYHALPSRLTPQLFRRATATGVLVTAETSHYRRLARTQIDATDIVLEIGCDLGPTVEIIAQTVGVENVIGIDKSSDSIAVAKASHPQCQFIEMDIFRSSNELLALASRCSKILIDINGNRLLGAVVDALALVLHGCPKLDLVIVKSVELHRELQRRSS